MRNLVLFLTLLFCLLCSCIAFYGCSSQDLPTSTEAINTISPFDPSQYPSTEYQELDLQLASLEIQFQNFDSESRAFGWLKKVFKIIGCDAVGALLGSFHGGGTGATIGAILSSAAAATSNAVQFRLNSYSSNNPGYLNDKMNPQSSALDSIFITQSFTNQEDSIGYHHNYFLLNTSIVDTDYSSNIFFLVNNIIGQARTYFRLTQSEMTNMRSNQIELNDYLSNGLYLWDEDMDINDYFSSVISGCPNSRHSVRLFKTTFNSFVNANPQDTQAFFSSAYSMVINSSISQSDKEAVKAAIMAAAGSARLWIDVDSINNNNP